jgi:hypothetical protein
MHSRPETVTFDAHDAARLAQIRAGRARPEVVEDAGGALLPGEDIHLDLRLVPSRAEKVALDVCPEWVRPIHAVRRTAPAYRQRW